MFRPATQNFVENREIEKKNCKNRGKLEKKGSEIEDK